MDDELLRDPDEGPAYYWMITGQWEVRGTTKTETHSGIVATYDGDTYADVADRAETEFMREARIGKGSPTILMLHLAPNVTITATS